MAHETLILRDSYTDSVRLLEATREMLGMQGVGYAWALMATPANLETLLSEGFDAVDARSANDLVLAARGDDAAHVAAALDAGRTALFTASAGGTHETETALTHLADAVRAHPSTNVAIVSVPGAFATLEAHKALTAGLHVLLFSDNVSLDDEIELKRRARSLGRLVMGPGAGTAMLSGVGLGFANRVRTGPVGVVAAAGTGAQEVMSLLDDWGVGLTHVIGVGGRDLSAAVGGIMAESAMDALDGDAATEVILLVSKPPAPEIARSLLGRPRSKPVIAALIGLRDPIDDVADGVTVCNTLERGAVLAALAAGGSPPDLAGATADEVATAITSLSPSRRRLVGLFSGGTLCYETMTIATRHIGPIHSNTPLDHAWTLPAPAGAHVCLDLGEEEYTVGRPHPMIDPTARVEWLRQQVDDPSVAVVVLDVVLGDGSHPDPASLLAPVAGEIIASGAVVIAYVLGTDADPQSLDRQRRTMAGVGCIVTATAARAALAAAAVVNRDPALVLDPLDR
jgi:FdrA protein